MVIDPVPAEGAVHEKDSIYGLAELIGVECSTKSMGKPVVPAATK
jgi:hypothetical protein